MSKQISSSLLDTIESEIKKATDPSNKGDERNEPLAKDHYMHDVMRKVRCMMTSSDWSEEQVNDFVENGTYPE